MQDIHWPDYFDEILNAFQDGFLIVAPRGRIRYVNRALERLTGYTAGELIGASCELLDCDACELLRCEDNGSWCRLFEREKVENKRCMITRRDGSYVSALKNAAVLRDADGTIIGAMETYRDMTELDRKDIEIQELNRIVQEDNGFCGMIGQSRVMQQLFEITEKAARSDTTVLVTGESGTGKELVARGLHDIGRRKDGPFVKVNCAALSENLIESDLFGHVKGAFTGAVRHRKGLFEAAHGGDIFLDEIGDISLSTQVKLLRVLETRQITRVGGERTVDVDVRFIAATNRNLAEEVRVGNFREDLFFRISVFPINVPALRARTEDIALMVNSFINDFRKASGKQISGLSPAALRLFLRYQWPGNVRELKSALEYAFAVAGPGVIDMQHLPARLQRLADDGDSKSDSPEMSDALKSEEPREKRELLTALRRTGGNQTAAAKLLGVHRMTVFNRMRKYGIHLKKI